MVDLVRRPGAVLSLVVVMAGAACSSSTPKAVETSSPTLSPTPSETPSPDAPPSPTASATPTKAAPSVVPTGSESPAPVGQPACKAAAVTVTDADTVVKPGYRAEIYVLRTTAAPCQITGFPTVFVSGVTVTRGGQGLPPEVPKPVTLSPGTSLSFAVATGRTGACEDKSALTVVLPGTTTPKTVRTDLTVCDKHLGVSPVHRLGDDE